MSILGLSQSISAIGANCSASFLGTGGTSPYSYSVIPYGAGGTINASTGAYTAPSLASSDPNLAYDTIQVQDAASNTATTRILIGTPLLLLCDILQNQMNIASDHIYIWNQKLFQPTDSALYIAVSVISSKPFANTNEIVNGVQNQFVSVSDVVTIDVISRGPDARDRKEDVILALGSLYAEQQQEFNSFKVALLSTNFVNLSNIDGAAIPYRYQITLRLQYAYVKSQPAQYYDTFPAIQIATNV